MQQQNVPASACICVFTTLQNLQHTVRTIYGDSKSEYGVILWAVPYSDVGQGNGAGTVIWEVVSTPVLKMIKDEGFGFMYKTSIERKEIHFVGYCTIPCI
jgi:asparagine N-glycosylation enzyme membrane subunit Stt3